MLLQTNAKYFKRVNITQQEDSSPTMPMTHSSKSKGTRKKSGSLQGQSTRQEEDGHDGDETIRMSKVTGKGLLSVQQNI